VTARRRYGYMELVVRTLEKNGNGKLAITGVELAREFLQRE
jgi:hypothetical protein